MSLFLCLTSISYGRYCPKSVVKSGGFGKKIKKGDGQIGWLPIKEVSKPVHYGGVRDCFVSFVSVRIK